MKSLLTLAVESSVGLKARSLRIYESLSQQELANMAGVSREEVGLFEDSFPLRLDARRRILKELWAKKTGK